MSASVWQAVQELAIVWRSSPYAQDHIAGLGRALSSTGGSAPHIEAQPFYLWIYLPTTQGYEEFTQSAGARAWLEKSELLGHAYTTVIEWLRSRLNGYPYVGAPQLIATSPWTTINVSMRVPWLIELRREELQNRPTPPTIPFLGVDQATQLQAGAHLAEAIVSSPPAIELDTAWRALRHADKDQLHDAGTRLQLARYPQPADVSGSEDFRELDWAETELEIALRPLTGAARAFTDAFTQADRLIQQAAALFSQLVVYGEIRQINNVACVEQLDGSGGWHAVRSNTYFLPPVRQGEVLGFDHPYPRGVMLVAGITEELPFGHHSGAVTVYGRILADSRELAATASPIRLSGC